MIRNEIWTHCLVYNLIRQTMASAAVTHERTPRTLSFAGASQIVAGVMAQASVVDGSTRGKLADQKLESIASHRVGHRPDRVEPREEARAELRGTATPAV